MARRKQGAAQSVESTPIEEATQPMAETATAVLEPPKEEPPARQWRANPFPVKTVNLDGYKIQLQESRPVRDEGASQEADASGDKAPERKHWEMQIKFGSGSKDDMPSGEVLDFIKSQRLNVTTKAGEEKQVQLFHWNKQDQAWGMEIAFNEPATSREKARRVFNEVVEMVAQERDVTRQR
ncbi:MAG: hypothetical protein ACLQVF_28300 [Isosphaeraceae bacterium]